MSRIGLALECPTSQQDVPVRSTSSITCIEFQVHSRQNRERGIHRKDWGQFCNGFSINMSVQKVRWIADKLPLQPAEINSFELVSYAAFTSVLLCLHPPTQRTVTKNDIQKTRQSCIRQVWEGNEHQYLDEAGALFRTGQVHCSKHIWAKYT